MKFTGRIARVFEPVTGEGRNGKWMTQEFIFEYFESPSDRYSDQVLLKVFGQDKIEQLALKVNDAYTIGFGHSVHEYNGRFFNELRPYSFSKQASANEPEETQETQNPAIVPTVADIEKETCEGADLPF